MEHWKAVSDYEGYYEVSDLGRVRSLLRMTRTGLRGGKILKQSWRGLKGDRYLSVRLSVDGEVRNHLTHRLVLLAFKGEQPPGMRGCHYDDDRTNNHLSNLRWDTPAGNGRDRARNGRVNMAGCRGGTSQRNAERDALIVEAHASGVARRVIADSFGITYSRVSQIIKQERGICAEQADGLH